MSTAPPEIYVPVPGLYALDRAVENPSPAAMPTSWCEGPTIGPGYLVVQWLQLGQVDDGAMYWVPIMTRAGETGQISTPHPLWSVLVAELRLVRPFGDHDGLGARQVGG